MRVQFTIPGEPVSKERPRLGRNGGTYTPPKTKAQEAKIGYAFNVSSTHEWSTDGEYRVECNFHCKSNNKDVDNMLKVALDGLGGLAFDNDRQVVEVKARKYAPSKTPRTEIRVTLL